MKFSKSGFIGRSSQRYSIAKDPIKRMKFQMLQGDKTGHISPAMVCRAARSVTTCCKQTLPRLATKCKHILADKGFDKNWNM